MYGKRDCQAFKCANTTFHVQTLAAWLLENYTQLLGRPQTFAFIELGPGRGTLMKQVLTALSMMQGGQAMLDAGTLHMVEVSPELRQLQFEALQCSQGVTSSQVRVLSKQPWISYMVVGVPFNAMSSI